ncbi:MAG: hypothetical protein Q8O39_01245 [bacterium]|nr:hypothetical protein [bacterium]
MSFFSQKIKKQEETQIITTGLKVEDLIKKNVLEELKNKFSGNERIDTTAVVFHVMSKDDKNIASIVIDHKSPKQLKDGVAIITSSKSEALKRFIK